MAYDKKTCGRNADQGGPYQRDGSLTKGDTKRPQSYTGAFTYDGKPYMGRQSFRDYGLPKPVVGELLDGQYEPPAGPSFEQILKAWR